MNDVKIRIQEREPMVNVTHKLPPQLKEELERVASKQGVAQGEIVRAFLEFALDAYKKGKVTRIWGEGSENMKKFRAELAVGDVVIASGNVGKLTDLDELFVKMEIAKGVVIQTLREGVTDVVSTKRKLRA